MDNLIYTKTNSLTEELCKEILDLYELDVNKYEGLTMGGLNKNVKNTLDLELTKVDDINYSKWQNIFKILEKELTDNVKNYVKNIETIIVAYENNENNYRLFESDYLTRDTFLVQKYEKNCGKYIYHSDFQCNWTKNNYRVITFLWYLNTVNEGGETEIWGNYLIKPETGKLLLFPASWTFPHRGKMPISNDKYIITGWLYINKNT